MRDESSKHSNIRTRPGGRQRAICVQTDAASSTECHRIRTLCRSGACSMEDLYSLSLHYLAEYAIRSSNACALRHIGSTSMSRMLRVRDLERWIGAIVYSRSRGCTSMNMHFRLARHNATILSVARRCMDCRIKILTLARRSSRSELA